VLNPNGSYTRTAFPNSVIPATRINPIAAKVMALVLKPNLGVLRGTKQLPGHSQLRSRTVQFARIPVRPQTQREAHIFRQRHNQQTGQTNGLGFALQAYEAAGTPYVSSSYEHWRHKRLRDLQFDFDPFAEPGFHGPCQLEPA